MCNPSIRHVYMGHRIERRASQQNNAANLSDRDHIITLHLSKRLKNLKQSTEEEMKVTYMID